MNDQRPKKKTLLTSFADDSGSFELWFRDPVKLVAAALNDDPNRRKALMDGLETLAENDKQFRVNLMAILKELGAGTRGQRLRRPRYIDEWIFSHVNLLLQLEKAKSKDEAFRLTSEFFISNNIRTIGEAAVKKIYSEVKKDKNIGSVSTYNNL